MTAPWRTIDCAGLEGSLGIRRGQLVVTEKQVEEPITTVVPLADLALVLVGPAVCLGRSTLQVLGREDISVLFTDWRGVPIAGANGWPSHSRVAARHLAQARLTVPRRKNAWARIIKAKITGQAVVLKALHAGAAATRLTKIASSVRSGDPDNAEAGAARTYWSALLGPEESRVPRGGSRVNSLLDYGYGVLRGHGVRAVLGAGLSPPLGLFHRGRSNYFNLVDDIIEPFRPLVDLAAFEAGPDACLENRDVKRSLVRAMEQPYAESGESGRASLEALAQRLGRYVEGDIERLHVPAWIGPQVVEAADDGG